VSDRNVRNLAHLQESASTARVLNLLRIHERRSRDPEYLTNPFFYNPVLNRSLIIKHRLRRHEAELFFDGRQTATKLIFPIDGADLRVGGRSVFVGQLNYDASMDGLLGDGWMTDTRDREMLEIIDSIPLLDPFLLREQLRRNNREPGRCYFEISDGDMNRMYAFVQAEVQKLVDLCYQGQASGEEGSKLVRKILSNAVGAETEPLRLTLRLEKQQYQEGVFCWKGFLYYKWTLNETLPAVKRVSDAIGAAKPRGTMDMTTRAYLEKTRTDLQESVLRITNTARKTLAIYDRAFASLMGGQPTAFRDFLLSAPSMFTDLGERLGAINHITSFWDFRFPRGRLPVITPEELTDIFADFEASLAFPESQPTSVSQISAPQVISAV
jgi:hypothetical protein